MGDTHDVQFEGVGVGKTKLRCYWKQRVGGSKSSERQIIFASLPEIMLTQTLIYYWQEIFLFTVVSDSEAIL